MILILIFSLSFVVGITAKIICPENVDVGQEFSCKVNVGDIDGGYDLKVEIEKDGKTMADVWSTTDGKWKSAYYYLIDFSETQVKLKIKEEGNYNGILKVRQESKREFFDFDISVGISGNEKSDEEKENSEKKVVEKEILSDENNLNIEKNTGENSDSPSENVDKVISLSSEKSDDKEEVLYESKSFMSMEYAPYLFSLFLIFILIILLWEKF